MFLDPKKHLGRLIASIFGVVIAPIIAGLAVNYTQKYLDESKATQTPKTAEPSKSAEDSKKVETAAKDAPKETPKSDPAVVKVATTTPDRVLDAAPKRPLRKATRGTPTTIKLFNGKNLAGWYSYLGPPTAELPPIGKNKDPEQVFSVKDGTLRISGKVRGGLFTEDEYENYHLTLDFRWGDETWFPRKNRPRLSGVTLHAFGPDAAIRDHYPAGIRCQIGEEISGNLLGVFVPPERVLMSAPVTSVQINVAKGLRPFYAFKPGEPVLSVPGAAVHRLGYYDKSKDGKFEPGREWDKPIGAWNTLECICMGDEITVILNGTMINSVTQLNHTKGRICLISECAEIFFRNIQLKTLAPSVGK
jgi:Domain of Unknown Function (DUF1080)